MLSGFQPNTITQPSEMKSKSHKQHLHEVHYPESFPKLHLRSQTGSSRALHPGPPRRVLGDVTQASPLPTLPPVVGVRATYLFWGNPETPFLGSKLFLESQGSSPLLSLSLSLSGFSQRWCIQFVEFLSVQVPLKNH